MTWYAILDFHTGKPNLAYGAETWSTTKEQEQKLAAAQQAMERKMLNTS